MASERLSFLATRHQIDPVLLHTYTYIELEASESSAMQALLQSAADGTEKPRYRAACDACRQSKVRCSGNGVCVRCKKHDYKCRYSIAHRAGKPKGSKNKATLKKLENLQAGQGNNGTPSSSSRGKAVAQQRKRKKNIVSLFFFCPLTYADTPDLMVFGGVCGA